MATIDPCPFTQGLILIRNDGLFIKFHENRYRYRIDIIFGISFSLESCYVHHFKLFDTTFDKLYHLLCYICVIFEH